MRKPSQYYIPTEGPEDWRLFLADPDKHWKSGYSAKELAYCWELAERIPVEIQAILNTQPRFDGFEILFAVPEYKVPLQGGSGRASQNDLFVLGRTDEELVVIMVEGKASEPFGPTLGQWRKDGGAGKERRLGYLQSVLRLEGELPSDIRYQLLHRMASPVIVARQFHATSAVMLVHSFSDVNKWFEDYSAFLGLFDVEAQVGMLHEVSTRSRIALYSGWAKGISVA